MLLPRPKQHQRHQHNNTINLDALDFFKAHVGSSGEKFTPGVPEIVVIGSQSSGKSSVLNMIAGTGDLSVLMTDRNTGTRVPTKLQLVSN